MAKDERLDLCLTDGGGFCFVGGFSVTTNYNTGHHHFTTSTHPKREGDGKAGGAGGGVVRWEAGRSISSGAWEWVGTGEPGLAGRPAGARKVEERQERGSGGAGGWREVLPLAATVFVFVRRWRRHSANEMLRNFGKG